MRPTAPPIGVSWPTLAALVFAWADVLYLAHIDGNLVPRLFEGTFATVLAFTESLISGLQTTPVTPIELVRGCFDHGASQHADEADPAPAGERGGLPRAWRGAT
jgi:hypothetical protein